MNPKTLLLSLALCLPVATALRAEALPGETSSAIAQVEWQKLSGWVEAKDAHNHLRLRDRNGNLTKVTIDDRVQIFRDWRLIALHDVRLKDRITLKRSDVP